MNIFITGKPGVGKTSLVMEIIKELKLDAGGIIAPEIRNKEREGFKIVDLSTGEEKNSCECLPKGRAESWEIQS